MEFTPSLWIQTTCYNYLHYYSQCHMTASCDMGRLAGAMCGSHLCTSSRQTSLGSEFVLQDAIRARELAPQTGNVFWTALSCQDPEVPVNPRTAQPSPVLMQSLGSSAMSNDARVRQILGSASTVREDFPLPSTKKRYPLQKRSMSFTAKCNREHGRVRREQQSRGGDKAKIRGW